jgi:hypothetical protein
MSGRGHTPADKISNRTVESGLKTVVCEGELGRNTPSSRVLIYKIRK